MKFIMLSQRLNLSKNLEGTLCSLPLFFSKDLNKLYSDAEYLSLLQTIINNLESSEDLINKKPYIELLVALKVEHCKSHKSKKLVLWNLGLTTIPESIFKLEKLQTLDLSNNDISNLTDDLLKLSSLKNLILANNKLTLLPDWLNKMNQLKKLILPQNKIQSINLGSLPTSILWLNLSKNRFLEIPKAIYQLSKLKNLWICKNKIDDIDLDFLDFIENNPKFNAIYLFGNPLTKIPLYSWENNGLESLKPYLKAIRDGKVDDNEVKVIIIGSGNEGKTTLREQLSRSHQKNKANTPTEGIEISRIQLIRKEDGTIHFNNQSNTINFAYSSFGESKEIYNIKLWDLGGQEIMRSAHTLFLTDNSVYLLLWSERHSGKDKYEEIKYWLDLISASSPNSPIILVANHVFDENNNIIPLARPYINEDDIKFEYNNVQYFEQISALYRFGIDNLEAKIISCSKSLKENQRKIPLIWDQIKKKVEELLNQGESICDYENFKALCEDDPKIALTNDHKFEDILIWLKNIGVLLYYQHDSFLSQYLFIKPEWIFDFIYKIVISNDLREKKGRFTLESIEYITGLAIRKEKYIILELLKRENMCISLKGKADTYLLLQLAPEFNIKNESNRIMQNDYDLHRELVFKFQKPGMVNAVFSRLYNEGLAEDDMIWSNAIILKKEDGTQGIIFFKTLHKDKVIIRIKGENANGLWVEIDGKFNQELKDRSLDKDNVRNTYESFVACNCTVCKTERTEPFLFDQKIIDKMKTVKQTFIQCGRSYELVNVESVLHGVKQNKNSLIEEIKRILIKGEFQQALDNLENFCKAQKNINDHENNIIILKYQWSKARAEMNFELRKKNEEQLLNRILDLLKNIQDDLKEK